MYLHHVLFKVSMFYCVTFPSLPGRQHQLEFECSGYHHGIHWREPWWRNWHEVLIEVLFLQIDSMLLPSSSSPVTSLGLFVSVIINVLDTQWNNLMKCCILNSRVASLSITLGKVVSETKVSVLALYWDVWNKYIDPRSYGELIHYYTDLI